MKKITSLFVLMTLCFSIAIAKPKKEKNTFVKFQTTKGDLILKLYNETPKHRDNMIELVKSGFYDTRRRS